jgi:hypothetical protein
MGVVHRLKHVVSDCDNQVENEVSTLKKLSVLVDWILGAFATLLCHGPCVPSLSACLWLWVVVWIAG